MKLLNVLIKLISSGSKLDSVFVLRLDELLSKLAEVADKGGTLVLKLSLDGDQIVVEDELVLPKPAVKKAAPKAKPVAQHATPSKPSKLEQVKADAERMAAQQAKYKAEK